MVNSWIKSITDLILCFSHRIVSVYLGAHMLQENFEVNRVMLTSLNHTAHPRYSASNRNVDFDIAVVRLPLPVTLTRKYKHALYLFHFYFFISHRIPHSGIILVHK